MKPRVKLYISSKEVDGAFGEGKYRLLRAVHKCGSIQKAADSLDRSYRKAWGDIKRAQEGLGCELVYKTRGGKSGGSTQLTDYSIKLLDAWERYRDDARAKVEQCYNKHLKKILEKN